MEGIPAACLAAVFFVGVRGIQERAGSAPDYGLPYQVIHGFGGRTLAPFLGDTDRRTNRSIGFQIVRPEPRAKYQHKRGALLREVYFEHSETSGGDGFGPGKTDAIGLLVAARYTWDLHHGWGLYADVGWGLQGATHKSVDLPTNINSTPFLDLGFWIPTGKNAILVGARFLHISNGHIVRDDPGQNQLSLDVGYKF